MIPPGSDSSVAWTSGGRRTPRLVGAVTTCVRAAGAASAGLPDRAVVPSAAGRGSGRIGAGGTGAGWTEPTGGPGTAATEGLGSLARGAAGRAVGGGSTGRWTEPTGGPGATAAEGPGSLSCGAAGRAVGGGSTGRWTEPSGGPGAAAAERPGSLIRGASAGGADPRLREGAGTSAAAGRAFVFTSRVGSRSQAVS
jgi:hypothetical protein